MAYLDNRLFFDSSAPGFEPADFLVREIEGVEALCTPYEFRIAFECAIDGGIDPDALAELLAGGAQVGFGPQASTRRAGVLRQIELLQMESQGQRTLYEAILVPRFWLTTQTRRSRCFNEKTVPEVISSVLEEYGFADGTDFELRLNATYSAREYITQFEETDFAFLSRWMERLGIFYWFEQDEGRDKIIIADGNAAFVAAPLYPDVSYAHRTDDRQAGGIYEIRRRDRRMPKKVHVRDYNWRSPQSIVSGNADIDAEKGIGLQAFYGDHFATDGDGATYARVRAEGYNATKQIFTAWSVNHDFAPGCRFTVSGAPIVDFDNEYVIVRSVHRARQDSEHAGSGDYRNDIEAILQSVPYRAPRVTPWPRIDGVMHATVDAAAINAAAPIDEKGRYRVLMPYDLYGTYGGSATRWIRKAEPYSGPEYGMHFTLFAGCEVVIAHVGGDPDRPIIVATAPSGVTTSPLTSANATRSALRTRSGIIMDFEDNA